MSWRRIPFGACGWSSFILTVIDDFIVLTRQLNFLFAGGEAGCSSFPYYGRRCDEYPRTCMLCIWVWEGCTQSTVRALPRFLHLQVYSLPSCYWLLSAPRCPLLGNLLALTMGQRIGNDWWTWGTKDWLLASRRINAVVLLMLQTSRWHQIEANLQQRTHNCLAFPPTLSAFPGLFHPGVLPQ